MTQRNKKLYDEYSKDDSKARLIEKELLTDEEGECLEVEPYDIHTNINYNVKTYFSWGNRNVRLTHSKPFGMSH